MIHLLRLVQFVYFYTIRKCVCTHVLKPATKYKTTIVKLSVNRVLERLAMLMWLYL